MKLTRYFIGPATVLGLCVGLAGACSSKKPPGTNPPGETGGGGDGGSASADGGGSGDVSDGGDGGSVGDGGSNNGGNGGGSAPTSCDAKVADTPTLLFGDQVIFRPPIGVEFQLDDNPMVQQALMGSGFMSACDAIVKRVQIYVYEKNKKKKPAKLLEEFMDALAQSGFTGGTKSSPVVDTATDFHLSVEYPASGGNQAVVLYLAVARRNDKDFVISYETTPADYKLLKPTFQESAKSLFMVAE